MCICSKSPGVSQVEERGSIVRMVPVVHPGVAERSGLRRVETVQRSGPERGPTPPMHSGRYLGLYLAPKYRPKYMPKYRPGSPLERSDNARNGRGTWPGSTASPWQRPQQGPQANVALNYFRVELEPMYPSVPHTRFVLRSAAVASTPSEGLSPRSTCTTRSLMTSA